MAIENVKKDFVELVNFLQENQSKKVSTIMDQILALVEKKGGGSNGSTLFKNADGKVVAVYCYYHKAWELVEHIPYGAKAGTASGLNTMCKEGVSQWTKQQREAKKEEGELLAKVADGSIKVEDIPAAKASIEEQRKAIVAHSDQKHTFATLEELQAAI